MEDENIKIKDVITFIVILCVMIAYVFLSACIIAGLAVVVPWFVLTALPPVLAGCSDFCSVMVYLIIFGVLALVILFTLLFLCWLGTRLPGVLADKLL
ncbi:MAG: hypothetical protein J6T72_01095 [Alphaproteobacteria bacterium]|nr:hypothetical protein [Alphaproteobacteria bacterium]